MLKWPVWNGLSLLKWPADSGLLELLSTSLATLPLPVPPSPHSLRPVRFLTTASGRSACHSACLSTGPPRLRKSDPETWAHLKQLGDFLHLSYIWFHFLEPVFLLTFSNSKSILFDEETKSK